MLFFSFLLEFAAIYKKKCVLNSVFLHINDGGYFLNPTSKTNKKGLTVCINMKNTEGA